MPPNEPRLVGSMDSPMSLVAAAEEPVRVALADMPPALGDVERVSLLVEHITVDGAPIPQYGVFLDPTGDGSDTIYVGVMPFFGLKEANAPGASHELNYAFDVTDVVKELIAAGRWDPAVAQFRFQPVNQQALAADVAASPVDEPATVNVGSVSLFVS